MRSLAQLAALAVVTLVGSTSFGAPAPQHHADGKEHGSVSRRTHKADRREAAKSGSKTDKVEKKTSKGIDKPAAAKSPDKAPAEEADKADKADKGDRGDKADKGDKADAELEKRIEDDLGALEKKLGVKRPKADEPDPGEDAALKAETLIAVEPLQKPEGAAKPDVLKPELPTLPAPPSAKGEETEGKSEKTEAKPDKAETHGKREKGTHGGKTSSAAPVKPPCLHAAVVVSHFAEQETFSLTRCDGSPTPLAIERLSILARPGSAAKPDEESLAKRAAGPAGTNAKTAAGKSASASFVAPGIRRVDPKLVERLQLVVDHFAKTGKEAHVQVVSGYRPTSTGSFHASGHALDFRLDGVSNEALVAFCKTLPDTGCGYYPNSSFIHMDVRAANTGHVSWIDASGPGEPARYVAAWPPPASPFIPSGEGTEPERTAQETLAKLERSLPTVPAIDEHPASVASIDEPLVTSAPLIGE